MLFLPTFQLAADFATLHPDCHPNLLTQWPQFAAKLLHMLIKKKVLPEEIVNYLRGTITGIYFTELIDFLAD